MESTLFAADVPLSSAAGGGTSAAIHMAPVNPMPAWLIACLPLGLLVLSSVRGAGLIALLGGIGLAMHDREAFRRADHTRSNAYWWMICSAPRARRYLYLRARRLGDPWGYVVASALSPLLFVAVPLLAGAYAAV